MSPNIKQINIAETPYEILDDFSLVSHNICKSSSCVRRKVSSRYENNKPKTKPVYPKVAKVRYK